MQDGRSYGRWWMPSKKSARLWGKAQCAIEGIEDLRLLAFQHGPPVICDGNPEGGEHAVEALFAKGVALSRDLELENMFAIPVSGVGLVSKSGNKIVGLKPMPLRQVIQLGQNCDINIVQHHAA